MQPPRIGKSTSLQTVKSPDVIVAGLGPAGRAVAYRCARAGLDVLAIDPHPHQRWIPTYAAWADELPGWLAPEAIAATVNKPAAWTTREHVLDRPYCVLDSAALQDSLDLSGVTIVQDRVADVTREHVTLASGAKVRAGFVIDARGALRTPGAPEQTAFGVVTNSDNAAKALNGQQAWFMDWWLDNGASASAPRSFLYAVPLGGDRFLLEETCLVGSPALDLKELQRRLQVRLANRGVRLSGNETTEKVRFPVVAPGPSLRNREALRYGSRGAFMHPGTGYSVAVSLRLADSVATAITDGESPLRALWTPNARAVHVLRLAGLRTLLKLKPQQLAPFFASFFSLSEAEQRIYLSDRDDVAGMTRAMSKFFVDLPMPQRRVVMTATMSVRRDK